METPAAEDILPPSVHIASERSIEHAKQSIVRKPSDLDRVISATESNVEHEDKRPVEYHSSVVVKWTFVIILATQICMNFESGAIPSVLIKIKAEFDMQEVTLGLVGALPYVGLVVIAPLVGYVLQIPHWQQRITAISLLGNVGSLALLAFATSKTQLLISRVTQGAAQAGFTIYAPIWVDEFAADKHVTLWMSLLQGLGVFGLMLGYLVTGYMSSNGIKWQYSMMGQGIALLLMAIILWLCPAQAVNLRSPPPILHLAVSKHPSRVSSTISCKRLLDVGSDAGVGSDMESKSIRDTIQTYQLAHSNTDANPESEVGHKRYNRLAVRSENPASSKLSRSSTESANTNLAPAPPYWRMKTVRGDESRVLFARASGARSGSVRSSGVDSVGSLQTAQEILESKKLFHPRTFRTFVSTSPSGFVYEGLDMRLQSLGAHVAFNTTSDRKTKTLGAIPEEDVSSNNTKLTDERTVSKPMIPSLLINIWRLMNNLVYVCLVLAISTLFYCVTEAMGLNGTKVLIAFSAVAATAPTAGVFLGGWFIDFMGGYRSKEGLQKTLLICLIEAIFSASSGLGAALSSAFAAILAFDWFILFFGGALLPPLTGMVLATVQDRHLRALSSSISALTINLLGYTAGSFLPGVFTANFGLFWGMFSVYIFAWFGSLTVSVALIYAKVKSLEPIQHVRVIDAA